MYFWLVLRTFQNLLDCDILLQGLNFTAAYYAISLHNFLKLKYIN